jgi:hypothetical protein
MPAPAPAPIPQQLSPSATIGQKTLWAQIGSFEDPQAALAFWDRYRNGHPDFPVVRVRVTSPYMAQQRAVSQVNLRVGPFARDAFISNLCSTLEDDDATEDLQCQAVTDMGVASGPKSGQLPNSRYRQ